MNKELQNYNKEEWGGWKIVSEMLGNPDEPNGIYPTSECYQRLYEFVCEQKDKAKKETRQEIIEQIKEKIKEDNKPLSYGATLNNDICEYGCVYRVLEIIKTLTKQK